MCKFCIDGTCNPDIFIPDTRTDVSKKHGKVKRQKIFSIKTNEEDKNYYFWCLCYKTTIDILQEMINKDESKIFACEYYFNHYYQLYKLYEDYTKDVLIYTSAENIDDMNEDYLYNKKDILGNKLYETLHNAFNDYEKYNNKPFDIFANDWKYEKY